MANMHIMHICHTIFLTKTTAAQNEGALSYHRVRGLYFLAVVFVATICILAIYHLICFSVTPMQ